MAAHQGPSEYLDDQTSGNATTETPATTESKTSQLPQPEVIPFDVETLEAINVPALKDDLLSMGSSEQPEKEYLSADQINFDPNTPIGAINASRFEIYKSLHLFQAQQHLTLETLPDNQLFECYTNQHGDKILELRNWEERSKIEFAQQIKRFNDAQNLEQGETMLFSPDVVHLEGWEDKVAALEKDGNTVALRHQTDPYFGEYPIVDKNGRPQGYGFDHVSNDTHTDVRVTNSGSINLSKEPTRPRHDEKGLPPAIAHARATITYKLNKDTGEFDFTLAEIKPDGKQATKTENDAWKQYGVAYFDGLSFRVIQKNGKHYINFHRLDDHYERSKKSAESNSVAPLPKKHFKDIAKLLVLKNLRYLPLGGQLYYRNSGGGTEEALGATNVPPIGQHEVGVTAMNNYMSGKMMPAAEKIENGETLTKIYLDPNAPRPNTGHNKVLHYASYLEALKERKEQGFNAGLICVDENGIVQEGVTSSVGMRVRNKDTGEISWRFPKVVSDVLKERGLNNIRELKNSEIPKNLESITRDTTIEILKAKGETVEIGDFHWTAMFGENQDDNYEVLQTMVFGTAATAVPIDSITTMITENEAKAYGITTENREFVIYNKETKQYVKLEEAQNEGWYNEDEYPKYIKLETVQSTNGFDEVEELTNDILAARQGILGLREGENNPALAELNAEWNEMIELTPEQVAMLAPQADEWREQLKADGII